MGAEDGWAPASNGTEMLRDMGRNIEQLNRRNHTPRARDLLGPGIAARAIELFDWNAEETSFNGMFYTLPGGLNTPDDASAWIGTVAATVDGAGVMEVEELATSTYNGTNPRQYRRGFRTLANATREFTAWQQVFGPGQLPGGVTISTSGPWATAVPGPTSGIPFDCRGGRLRGMATCQGYGAGSTVLQVVLYIDGTPRADMALDVLHPDGVFVVIGPAVFDFDVTPGTHYAYWRQLSGSSNSSARGSLYGTVTDS